LYRLFFFSPTHPPPYSPLFPYTTLFRSLLGRIAPVDARRQEQPEAAEALRDPVHVLQRGIALAHGAGPDQRFADHHDLGCALELDRKSTRLNSSHVKISYAVFCLKKKNN